MLVAIPCQALGSVKAIHASEEKPISHKFKREQTPRIQRSLIHGVLDCFLNNNKKAAANLERQESRGPPSPAAPFHLAGSEAQCFKHRTTGRRSSARQARSRRARVRCVSCPVTPAGASDFQRTPQAPPPPNGTGEAPAVSAAPRRSLPRYLRSAQAARLLLPAYLALHFGPFAQEC